MDKTSLLWLIALISLWSGTTGQAHVTLRPSRTQFFTEEHLSLSCEDDNNGGLARQTLWRNNSEGKLLQCGDSWGKKVGSSCSISMLLPWDSGSYWCESSDGSTLISSMVNLTVTGGSVILQSPVHPAMEGENVTLTCTTKTATSNLPTDFYKDGSLIKTEPAGRMTIHHVSRSHEGQYKCNMRGHGKSPSSWISVTDKPSTSEAPSTPEAPLTSKAAPTSDVPSPYSSTQLIISLTCHLVIFCPYFISTVLMVSIYCQRTAGNKPHENYPDHTVIDAVTTVHHL
ncbi:low affinity immunoglobulin gamma Fc region receptor II-like isoform 2-T2 [Pholidichthys leucotaenia]